MSLQCFKNVNLHFLNVFIVCSKEKNKFGKCFYLESDYICTYQSGCNFIGNYCKLSIFIDLKNTFKPQTIRDIYHGILLLQEGKKIVHKFSKEEKFDCIRLSHKMILYYDRQFEAPRFEIRFDEFYESTMRIWLDRFSHKEAIEKTRTVSINLFSSSNGTDTVLLGKWLISSRTLVTGNELKLEKKIR